MDAPLKPVLQVEDVSLHFSGVATSVFQHVNLSIAQGEVVGITGQNGSGKTSLCNVICGLVRPTSGCVRIDGSGVSSASKSISFWQMTKDTTEPCQISRTFQARSSIQGLKAWQFVEHNDSAELAALGTFSGLIEAFFVEPLRSIFLPNTWTKSEELRKRCLQELLGLELDEAIAEQSLETLSLGIRRVLEVLRALKTVRRLFVLDEPFTNLRPKTARVLSERIREQAKTGLAGLVIDHDRFLLREVAHRLYELTPAGLVELQC